MSIYQRPLRPDELMHWGILGMHWGVRRYQNPDGTLTEAGKRRKRQMDYNDESNLKNTAHADIWKKRQHFYDTYVEIKTNNPKLYETMQIGMEITQKQINSNPILKHLNKKATKMLEKQIWNKKYLRREDEETREKRKKELNDLIFIYNSLQNK